MKQKESQTLDAPLPPADRAGVTPKQYNRVFYRILLIFTIALAVAGNIVWPTPRWDIYEMIGAGREWVIGNFRGDISSAWIAEIFAGPFGGAPFMVYIASALCTAGTIWCVWRLCREYLDAKRACFAALLLTTFYYTCIGGIFYNRNVVHCLFWYIAILIYFYTLKTGKLLWWIALGVSMGFALLSHYPAIFLAGAMVTYALGTSHRKVFKTPGPYLAVAIASSMFLPHVLFLHEHYDHIHAYINTKKPKNGCFPLAMVTGWGSQLGMIAPMILSLLPILIFKKDTAKKAPRRERPDSDPLKNFPLAMLLLPMPFLVIAQVLNGVAFRLPSYGFQLWELVPLCLLYYLPSKDDAPSWKKSITLCAVFATIVFLTLPIQTLAGYFFPGEEAAEHLRPARALSRQIDELWAAEYPDLPCAFVGGEQQTRFLYGVFSQFKPQIDSYDYAGWNVDKSKSEGGILVWLPKDAPDGKSAFPDDLKKRFPTARFVAQVTAPCITFPGIVTDTWNVAILPPAGETAKTAEAETTETAKERTQRKAPELP